jgi:hypothetical protein
MVPTKLSHPNSNPLLSLCGLRPAKQQGLCPLKVLEVVVLDSRHSHRFLLFLHFLHSLRFPLGQRFLRIRRMADDPSLCVFFYDS